MRTVRDFNVDGPSDYDDNTSIAREGEAYMYTTPFHMLDESPWIRSFLDRSPSTDSALGQKVRNRRL